jgi:hypothetical protein
LAQFISLPIYYLPYDPLRRSLSDPVDCALRDLLRPSSFRHARLRKSGGWVAAWLYAAGNVKPTGLERI